MALTATDKLLAGWLGFVSLIALTRAPVWSMETAWLLVAHALFGLLLWIFRRGVGEAARRRVKTLQIFYPLLLLPFLYAEIGILNNRLPLEAIFAHDHVVQRWEQWLFGEQVSLTWIRRHPSLPWSQVFHGAYLFYYPIIFGGPPLLLLRASQVAVRRVIFTMMLTFVVCYVVFLMWPVAGPSYTFPRPEGPVVEVAMAKLLYTGLEAGSSVGAAFPSSHVAATIAVTIALGRYWAALGWVFAVPAVLLSVGTVYTQMHYAVDALAGVVVGVVIGLAVGVGRTWSKYTWSKRTWSATRHPSSAEAPQITFPTLWFRLFRSFHSA